MLFVEVWKRDLADARVGLPQYRELCATMGALGATMLANRVQWIEENERGLAEFESRATGRICGFCEAFDDRSRQAAAD